MVDGVIELQQKFRFHMKQTTDTAVTSQTDGDATLERAAPRPALVITDFMMPILDGAGFLKAMRETETQREIPCIVISSMPERNVRARIDGYRPFLREPDSA
jgi:CheY-like chemotaxis protein